MRKPISSVLLPNLISSFLHQIQTICFLGLDIKDFFRAWARLSSYLSKDNIQIIRMEDIDFKEKIFEGGIKWKRKDLRKIQKASYANRNQNKAGLGIVSKTRFYTAGTEANLTHKIFNLSFLMGVSFIIVKSNNA